MKTYNYSGPGSFSWRLRKFDIMVLYRHPDHSLTLRAFSLCGVAPFYPPKSAKCQRAIGPASRALAYDSHAVILNTLLGFVFLDLVTWQRRAEQLRKLNYKLLAQGNRGKSPETEKNSHDILNPPSTAEGPVHQDSTLIANRSDNQHLTAISVIKVFYFTLN